MIPQQYMVEIKQWAQILGILAVIVGLFKAAYEVKENRRQRDTELLWKKINTAKELLNDIHIHDFAKNAVHMLDWCGGEADYEVVPGVREKISYQDVLSALQSNHPLPGSPKVVYIRDCFDWFFYRVDRIEHYIRRKLIDFVDVETVFKTYAKQIKQDQEIYDDFLCFHGYDLAKQFFSHHK